MADGRSGIGEWGLRDVEGIHAGSIVYPPKGTYGPRVQNGVQLVTLHSGSLELLLEGELHAISPGSTVLLLPGRQEHFLFSRSEDSWHRWISVLPAGVVPEPVIETLSRLPLALPLSESMNKLIDIALAMTDTAHSDRDVLKQLGLAALLLYEAETQQEAERNRVHRAVMLAKCDIRFRFMEPLTLGELASVAGVTPEHLIRLFQQYERTTPVKYLWKVRLERAVDLLATTGLSIGEIADRTGFKNTHHFSRMFKQATGRTPKEHRRARG
ncbi:helix-turn-helix domain-containing protein [Paenibacillus koleovorans]|uniref:helix-turn-helix domain-containing protein n=1 Tax=Paenibacillus koleovorans TaxID=121608 RepID=UPI000FD92D70|nr:AraC family transcriptional regulator [Paenibacillus koleovorans]